MGDTVSPYQMKEEDKDLNILTPTVKAFENSDFLRSRDARMIRILTEFQEPATRLNAAGVKGTLLFFGSARAMLRHEFDRTKNGLQEQAKNGTADEKAEAESKLTKFGKCEWMCEWSEKIQELSRRMTEWVKQNDSLKMKMGDVPEYMSGNKAPAQQAPDLLVCTGGGPGMMEAANRGAAMVPGALSMGMGISLPFEKGLNPFVDKHLAFEFHYFFTRKFWMMHSAKALVIGPGGMGTCDELFELLTLRQTGKIPHLPIVLMGSTYWKTFINWDAFVAYGTASQHDVDSLFFTDSVDEAFAYITKELTAQFEEVEPRSPKSNPSSPTA